MNTESMYKQLTEAPMFKNVEKEGAFIPVESGLKYGDNQTDFNIAIAQLNEEEAIITDFGRALAYLDEAFELTAPAVIAHIRKLTDYYKLGMKKQQLTLLIESLDEFIDGYLRMLFCSKSMDSMRIFFR